MTKQEKHQAEKIANKLVEAIHDMNQLNKEQIDYLDLLFKKLFIQQDIDKLIKDIK